jgi:predicted enzyme related to lactoylglutathione lyase
MALADEVGVISWYSLMTKDVEASNQYYTELLGWTVEDFPMPDGQSVPLYAGPKGMFANPVPVDGDEVPPHWIPYFTVADVDASCARVTELGGTVCVEAFDLPSVGRTAVVTDPGGAAFHLFTPENKDNPMNVMGGEPGQPCWLEMMVEDPAAVTDFYAGVLGWDIKDNPSGNPAMEATSSATRAT